MADTNLMAKHSIFYVCVAAAAAAAAESLQSCPTLCDPRDSSPPGSPIPGILQARTLEWVAIPSPMHRKWKVKVKSLSRAGLLATPWTAAHQAPPSMGFSRQNSTGVGCHCLLQCMKVKNESEVAQPCTTLSFSSVQFSSSKGTKQCWCCIQYVSHQTI